MMGEGIDFVIVWYNEKPSIRFITWSDGVWYAAELPMQRIYPNAEQTRTDD